MLIDNVRRLVQGIDSEHGVDLYLYNAISSTIMTSLGSTAWDIFRDNVYEIDGIYRIELGRTAQVWKDMIESTANGQSPFHK